MQIDRRLFSISRAANIAAAMLLVYKVFPFTDQYRYQ